MKRIMIVSTCTKRGNSIGLIGSFLDEFANLDKNEFQVDLCNIGYFQDFIDSDYHADNYYGIRKNIIDRLILKIPKIRSWYSKFRSIKHVKNTFNKYKYDLMVVYSVPSYVEKLIRIAHINNCKTILYPWGANDIVDRFDIDAKLQRAFDATDYVTGIENSNCSLTMLNKFKVPSEKYFGRKPFLTGVVEIQKVRSKYSRSDLERILGIRYSSCNIICGYNAFPDMLHEQIINSICDNLDILPDDYQLIFPMSYPRNDEYVYKIQNLCKERKLNHVIFTNYLSDEQVACLHLLSDYFINIQHADSGNAFQIESLFCGITSIVGAWLEYKQFEIYGKPYITIDSVSDLSKCIRQLLLAEIEKPVVPSKLIDMYNVPADYDSSKFWENIIDKS